MCENEHGMVFHCKCGKTFEKRERFNRHVFEQMAQYWIEENLGEPFASYHEDLIRNMGGITAYDTAKHEEIDTEPTEENVREASLEFARGALVRPNVQMLLDEV